MTDAVRISVCVASRGEPGRLREFFQSLGAVRFPVPAELVLVLNTSRPPALEALYSGASPFGLVTLVEPVPGKSRSLNRAIAVARGELLVFTDDDVVFDAAWLENLWSAAQRHPDVTVFGGRIRALGNVPRWIERSVNLQAILLGEHDWSAASARYPAGQYPFGPNMAIRRSVLLQSRARWCESLGPGTRLPVGDEAEFLASLSPPAAVDRMFVADAVVHHRVEASYFPLRAALRRSFQAGWVAGRLNTRHGRRGGGQARVLTQVAERLRKIGGFRELACNVARSCGYAAGRYLSRSARLA